jgi:CHAT domain-containing protein/Tfp pilus assembly protein PilF
MLRRLIALSAALLLLATLPTTTPPANAAPRNAAVVVEKSFFKYFNAGDYGAALIEAQKLVPLIRSSSGEQSLSYVISLAHVAESLANLDRSDEAIPVFRQAIAINDSLQQPNRNQAVALRAELGGEHDKLGRLHEAETSLREALAMLDPTLPPITVFTVYNNLGNVLWHQGRYHDAEKTHRQALAVWEKTPSAPGAATSMQNLGIVLMRQGRFAETEALFKRALSIREQVLGPNHKEVAHSLLNLGALLTDVEGRYQEAIPLYKRAIGILAAVLGVESADLAMTLGNLAIAYKHIGQYGESEKLQLQALAIREKTLGPNHQDVALGLNSLGDLYAVQHRWADAEKAQLRSLAIWESVSGPENPDVAIPLNSLGFVYRNEKRFDEAERAFKRALKLRQTAFGPNDPGVAETLDDLSLVAAARDQISSALDYSRKATALLLSDASLAVSAGKTQIGGSTLIARDSDIFRHQVAYLSAAAAERIVADPAAGREAFTLAQWASQSSAAAAVAQMGIRFAAGDDALAALIRETQDLAAAWSDKDTALTAARSLPAEQQNRATVEQLEKALSDLEAKLASAGTRLQQQFPDYAALSNPKPLTVEAAQKLLGADEALVYFMLHGSQSYVFALAKNSFTWRTLPFGAEGASEKVTAFRKGLDVDMIEDQNYLESIGKKRELFDLATAYDTYAALLGPVDELIKGKHHLLVVPSGSLTALPFHLLLTEKPSAIPDFEHLDRYRGAPWLIKRQAITVLPSVAGLQVLRVLGRKDQGSKPMIGFGNPVFNPGAAATAERERGVRKASRLATRSYTDFWQGAGVDRRQLAQSLPQLPETEDELKAVASNLGASPSDIFLGRNATVTAVKQAPLGDFRVVYFATHGLVAGDVKDLAEPSLALTIPSQPSDFDDGLLTASEVAKLKLNADWVVLSACNTIAGGKPGAEALSGLARAFFYGGARALLVSHWSVASDAATRLMTGTFDALNAQPALGRAEAMRRSMLAFVNDASQPHNAYPAMWGAFSIIGEGAARQVIKDTH